MRMMDLTRHELVQLVAGQLLASLVATSMNVSGDTPSSSRHPVSRSSSCAVPAALGCCSRQKWAGCNSLKCHNHHQHDGGPAGGHREHPGAQPQRGPAPDPDANVHGTPWGCRSGGGGDAPPVPTRGGRGGGGVPDVCAADAGAGGGGRRRGGAVRRPRRPRRPAAAPGGGRRGRGGGPGLLPHLPVRRLRGRLRRGAPAERRAARGRRPAAVAPTPRRAAGTARGLPARGVSGAPLGAVAGRARAARRRRRPPSARGRGAGPRAGRSPGAVRGERDGHARALGVAAVPHQGGAVLLRLRVGDAARGDGVARVLRVPPLDHDPPGAGRGDPAARAVGVGVALVSDYAGRRPDQGPGGCLLARPDLHAVPL